MGISAKESLEILKEGNNRFVQGKLKHPGLDSERRNELLSDRNLLPLLYLVLIQEFRRSFYLMQG